MKQRLSSLLLALLLALSLAGCELLAPAPSPLSGGSFDPDSLPAYSGEPYVEVNGNVPYFTEEDLTTDAFEEYSPLDALGRAAWPLPMSAPRSCPPRSGGRSA